jgi:hypothetical protein
VSGNLNRKLVVKYLDVQGSETFERVLVLDAGVVLKPSPNSRTAVGVEQLVAAGVFDLDGSGRLVPVRPYEAGKRTAGELGELLLAIRPDASEPGVAGRIAEKVAAGDTDWLRGQLGRAEKSLELRELRELGQRAETEEKP